MSMHKKPLTPLEEEGLRLHGLDIGTPSQLSDVFRHGIAWAISQTQSAPEPVQGEATVKECLTVELVENSTYGGLHIKEWRNHGLSAGRHTLYTAAAKPDAELVALKALLPALDDALEDLELHGRHGDQGYRKLKDWYRKVALTTDRIDAKLAELQ